MTRRHATAAISGLVVCLGLILLGETALSGGGTTGYLLGTLFVLAGLGRLYLSVR
jgi:hypothetical protein